MRPDCWQDVERLYRAALACDPARRPAFLAQASGGDEQLLNEVQSLLEQTSDARLDRPVREPDGESRDPRYAAGTPLGEC